MDSDYLGRLKKWLNLTKSEDTDKKTPQTCNQCCLLLIQADERDDIDDSKTLNPNSNSDYTLLMQASERGNILKVKDLIRAGDDLNIQADKGGDTALIMVVRHGHTEIVEALIAAGADLNIQTHGYAYTPLKYTALMYAIHGNQLKMVEILLEAKANPNLKDGTGYTAYTLASAINNQKIIALLHTEWLKKSSMVSAMAHYLSPWSSPMIYSNPQITHKLLEEDYVHVERPSEQKNNNSFSLKNISHCKLRN